MKIDPKLCLRLAGILAICNCCLYLCACPWEDTALNIIKLLQPAIASLISILVLLGVKVPQTVMATYSKWSAEAQNDLLTLKELIKQCKDATASEQGGLIAKIQDVINVLAQNVNVVLSEMHIDSPEDEVKVKAAMQAIVGFLDELATLIPALKASMSMSKAHDLHSKFKASTAKFKADFNEAVKSYGEQYTI